MDKLKRYACPGVITLRADNGVVKIKKSYSGAFLGIDDYYNLLTLTPDEARDVAGKLYNLARAADRQREREG